MKSLLLLSAVVAFVVAQQAVPTADAVVKVRAVDRGDAIIPCGQSKIFLDGPGAFVSWVKDGRRVVYRFPINNSNTDERSFNEICYRTPDIKPCRERTSLFLQRVTKDDAGFYRCRIHYNASPAIDFDFQLTIVERPGYPKVYFDNGTAVDQDYIGPIPLGTNVTLLCEVEDSNESSVVQWERDGHRVVGSELIQPGLHRAVLELHAIQRDSNGARYACIAQPADVTLPLTKEVEIKMYLPPQSITIDVNDKYDFEVGIPRVIDCIITGFVPTPIIQWYLDDKLLKPDTHQETPGKNVTISSLTLVTKRSDHNRILSCRARNEYFDEVFSSSFSLHVGFKPICAVVTRNVIQIKPRVMEKLVCIVNSDPPPSSFHWTFSNTKIVSTPVQATEIPTRYKSTLTWIPHIDEIGNLTCTATNNLGKQDEPCQFDIRGPNCTNEKGAVMPCKRELVQAAVDGEIKHNRMLNDGKIDLLVQNNNKKPSEKENEKSEDDNEKKSNHIYDDLIEGSQVIETQLVEAKDSGPWWAPLIFLLGSLFLLGLICYVIGHWILIKWKDRDLRTDRMVAMAYSNANRRSISPSSQRGLGSYHREPDVIERFPHQTNITITPTATFGSARIAPTCEEPLIYPICNETHTYCV